MAPAGLLHRCTGHWGGTDPVLPESGQRTGFTEKFCTYIEENNWDAAKQLADTTRGEIVKLATIVMAAMEIMSFWKISSATGQSGPWTNLNRTCPI